MHRGTRIVSLIVGGMLLTSPSLLAQRGFARSAPPTGGYGFGAAPTAFNTPTLYFPSFPFPQFAGYGFRELTTRSVDPSWTTPSYPPASAPNYWWVGPSSNGERQDGYNPDAGYAWESVGALVLTTFPLKAQVTLDGTCVGTADKLGPFQLPVGAYTLRVEAVGYQASETVVKFDEPGVRELDIKLKPLTVAANAGKRN